MPKIASRTLSKVVPFFDRKELKKLENLDRLEACAKQCQLEGFERVVWYEPIWQITSGRLCKQTGKSSGPTSLSFNYPPKLEQAVLEASWSRAIKALTVLRFHRYHQSVSNQRNFIAAACYVAYEATRVGRTLIRLVPEDLEAGCLRISTDYAPTTAYNLHKAVAEFAQHCDANGLCQARLEFRFSRFKRPELTSGVGYKRLDDPSTTETRHDKLIDAQVFQVLGALYRNVPQTHPYRFYVLVLALLACLGRRFSEVVLLINQEVSVDSEGRAYLTYFPRKGTTGDSFTPHRKLYLPTATRDLVGAIIAELGVNCSAARDTANHMLEVNGPDMRFLAMYPDSKKFHKVDLKTLGLNPGLLDAHGWLRINGYASSDNKGQNEQDQYTYRAAFYTTKKGLKAYCQKDFFSGLLEPIHIDQKGKKFFLDDLLLVKFRGLSSGAYSRWIATACTHSMMTTFLRYFGTLTQEFAASSTQADFTSHHFRHTLNTLLDEGGLSDLLQTEWFARTNPRDTKAYQHTSPEKKMLMVHADIKAGKMGGQIVESLQYIPQSHHDAYLKARIGAVHDQGAGYCVHNFAQTPCIRHLQCSANCREYVWRKDGEQIEEIKRQYALTLVARDTAHTRAKGSNPKRSLDWLAHNEKKLRTLSKQLTDNNFSVEEFDAHEYLRTMKNV